MKLEAIYVLRRRDKRRPGAAEKIPRVFAVFTITKGRRWLGKRLYRGSLWIENGTDGRDYVANFYENEGDYSRLALLKSAIESALSTLADEKDAAMKKKIIQISGDVLEATGTFGRILNDAGYFPQRIK